MRAWLGVFSLWLWLWGSMAWADTVVYYRSVDGVVVGSTTSPGKVDVVQELPNWGAGVEALRVPADLKVTAGQMRKVVNGALSLVPDPTYVVPVDPSKELETAITTATTLDELKAALLGKTRPAKIMGRTP